MATYTLRSEGGSPAAFSPGRITYGLPEDRVYRVEAREGTIPEDLSSALDALSSGLADDDINVSPNGEWLVVESERFDQGCEGWACLAIVAGDLSAEEAVYAKLPGRGVVHPSQGTFAVASSGDLIVYQDEGEVGNHVADLFAVMRTGEQSGLAAPCGGVGARVRSRGPRLALRAAGRPHRRSVPGLVHAWRRARPAHQGIRAGRRRLHYGYDHQEHGRGVWRPRLRSLKPARWASTTTPAFR